MIPACVGLARSKAIESRLQGSVASQDVIADPDGHLLRFFTDLSRRSAR